MRVFGYIRVSGSGQVKGDGPERQQEKITAFCAAHSLELVRCFLEPGVSGTVEALDRDAFAEMIARAEAGEATAIVVERLDRLARDLLVQEILVRECSSRQIKIFATDQGVLLDVVESADPTRKLIRQILGALAEWDKSSLVLKLRVARQRKRAKTGRCEGIKPFGTLPGEREALVFLHGCRSKGLTHLEIVTLLNEGNFHTRHRGPWTLSGVKKMIRRHPLA